MLEGLKYRGIRKAADSALRDISPIVPTWNSPALSERDIVPPPSLEGSFKLQGPHDDVTLEIKGVSSQRLVVEKTGVTLRVSESYGSGLDRQYTEVIFREDGTVSPMTVVDREHTIKPKRQTRRRIVQGLTPELSRASQLEDQGSSNESKSPEQKPSSDGVRRTLNTLDRWRKIYNVHHD